MMSRPNRTVPEPHERLVDAYLADLQRALRNVEADEREEVVASVREHIETALLEHRGEPTSGDVEALLRQLGPVEQIAQDAGDGLSRSGGETGNVQSREGWILVALAVASLLFVVIPFVAVPLALGVVVTAAISMRGKHGPVRRRYRIAAVLSGLALVITVLLALFLLAARSAYSSPAGPETGVPVESPPTVEASPASDT